MSEHNQIQTEWSYLIEAEKAGVEIDRLKINPEQSQLLQLTERLGVNKLHSLEADLKFKREQGNTVIHVFGVLKAEIEQSCVVTLDPIHSNIEEQFEAWYADQTQAVSLNKVKRLKELEEEFGDDMPILDESEDPEAIVDGQIDLGELVTQYLSLSINPYPHAEGAVHEVGDDDVSEGLQEKKPNPFEALRGWKEKLDEQG